MPASSVPRADVRISNATGADALLDAAHDHMVAFALLDGAKGVLVTQYSHGDYTFTLSNLVPFGETREKTGLSQSQKTDNVSCSSWSRDPEPPYDHSIEEAPPGEAGEAGE
jgi:hypothetical protein